MIRSRSKTRVAFAWMLFPVLLLWVALGILPGRGSSGGSGGVSARHYSRTLSQQYRRADNGPETAIQDALPGATVILSWIPAFAGERRLPPPPRAILPFQGGLTLLSILPLRSPPL